MTMYDIASFYNWPHWSYHLWKPLNSAVYQSFDKTVFVNIYSMCSVNLNSKLIRFACLLLTYLKTACWQWNVCHSIINLPEKLFLLLYRGIYVSMAYIFIYLWSLTSSVVIECIENDEYMLCFLCMQYVHDLFDYVSHFCTCFSERGKKRYFFSVMIWIVIFMDSLL